MPLTPRHLVRLFPRIWRVRYGVEFEALLESSQLTWREVGDVLRRAAAEWIAHTNIGRIILGAGLAFLGAVLASVLAAMTPGALRHHEWPIGLLVVFGLAEMGMGCRFMWCALTGTRVGIAEQKAWITALFVTSTAAQWGALVAQWVPPPSSLSTLWMTQMSLMVMSCTNSLAMSRIGPRGFPPVQLHKRPPARPLGLA
jgi:hypothetical protein